MVRPPGISTTAVDKNLAMLKQKGILRRVGPAKGDTGKYNHEI